MLRCLVVAVSVLVVSTTLVAQESLWSGTMTAGKDESVFAVGFNRNPEAPIFGELSDSEFDFRGTTYRVYSLAQLANHELVLHPAVPDPRIHETGYRVGAWRWPRGRFLYGAKSPFFSWTRSPASTPYCETGDSSGERAL